MKNMSLMFVELAKLKNLIKFRLINAIGKKLDS
jgi:hypothetical protein